MKRWQIHEVTPTRDGSRLTELGGVYANTQREAETLACVEFQITNALAWLYVSPGELNERQLRKAYSGGRW